MHFVEAGECKYKCKSKCGGPELSRAALLNFATLSTSTHSQLDLEFLSSPPPSLIRL
jgi:hypothetical protein